MVASPVTQVGSVAIVPYNVGGNHTGAANTLTVNATATSSLLVYGIVTPSTGASSISDTSTLNTWSDIQASGSGEPQLLQAWATTTATTHSITGVAAQWSGAASDVGCFIEVTGANMSGTQITAHGTSPTGNTTTSATTGSVTPNAGDLVIGMIYWRVTNSSNNLDSNQLFTGAVSPTYQSTFQSIAGSTHVKMSVGILQNAANAATAYTSTLGDTPITQWESVIIVVRSAPPPFVAAKPTVVGPWAVKRASSW